MTVIMKGGTQGFPRHEVSDKQEVLFEDVSPSTAFSIRQQMTVTYANAAHEVVTAALRSAHACDVYRRNVWEPPFPVKPH